MLHHVVCIRRHRAEELSWQVRTSSFAYASREAQRQTFAAIGELEKTGIRRKSATELVAPQDRIRLIGMNLAKQGDAWAKRHPHELRWLKSQRVTPQQAVAVYRDWSATLFAADPFFISKADRLKQKEARR